MANREFSNPVPMLKYGIFLTVVFSACVVVMAEAGTQLHGQPKSRMLGSVSTTGNDNNQSLEKCDSDLCTVGDQFCWHSQDGEDDRQCLSCRDLQLACATHHSWETLTDCLVYKCFEPQLLELRQTNAKLALQDKRIQLLTVVAIVLGGLLVLLLGVLVTVLFIYRWKRSASKTARNEDTEALISKDNESTTGSTGSTISDNKDEEAKDTDTTTGAKPVEETPAGQARVDPPEQLAHGQTAAEESRQLPPGLKHIPPTSGNEDRAVMVTNLD